MPILQQNDVSSGRDEVQQRGGHRIGGLDLGIVTDSVESDDIRPLDAVPVIFRDVGAGNRIAQAVDVAQRDRSPVQRFDPPSSMGIPLLHVPDQLVQDAPAVIVCDHRPEVLYLTVGRLCPCAEDPPEAPTKSPLGQKTHQQEPERPRQ